jgi:septum formation protein
MPAVDFIYLASASPRRRQLLRQLGLRFESVAAEVDETLEVGETAEDYVLRLARRKAETAAGRLGDPRAPVLAADTAVVVEGAILGKPGDRTEALGMLARLSGRRHQVLSAVALWAAGKVYTAVSASSVTFRKVSVPEAEAYWRSGEPLDKAGGYAIQGRGALFIERLEGSYSGVMGLPLYETAQLLQQAGVHLLDA